MKYSVARFLRLAIVLNMVAVLCGSPAQGAILPAVQDNYVLKNQGLQGTGEETTLTIKEASVGQGNARIAFLKFDLSSIAISSANTASFSITSTASPTADFTLRAYALNTGATGFDWTESTLTYANRPAPSATNQLVDLTKATVIGSDISILLNEAARTFSFNFANVENYRQADNTLTIIFLNTVQSLTGPSLAFASSENATVANRPTLNVTAIPEPATTALLGIGLLGLFAWQRRK